MKKRTMIIACALALLGLSSFFITSPPLVSHSHIVYAAATSSQKKALSKAEKYYKLMNMSKLGIYDQLTSDVEKYSAEDAQYAVDHLKANYKTAALKRAKSYYKIMHMSKQDIYDRLSNENGDKFTAEQAQYAIDHAKLDYKKAALEKAKSYKKTLDLSSDEIYEQLTSAHRAKFTTEEAQYTIDHLND